MFLIAIINIAEPKEGPLAKVRSQMAVVALTAEPIETAAEAVT